MPATMVWGKGFRVQNITLRPGEVQQEVLGIDGGSEMISWASVAEMESVAEQHGVNRDCWPTYRECENESDVPLEDAERRSSELRTILARLDSRIVEGSYWLSFVRKILLEGNSFFIMV